ncbi:MAG: small basic protein [Pirellulales bacterium]
MTMDKSLRRKSALARSRSVLTRAERIDRLKADDRWQEGQSPLGLAKVRVYKLAMKKKKKKKEEEGDAAATPAAAKTEAAKPAGGKAGGKK